MDQEKEISSNTSGVSTKEGWEITLIFMTCVYFCLLFRITLGYISQVQKQIIPEVIHSDNPIFSSIYYLASFLWFLYAFWSVILMLRESTTAIKSIKLSVPFLTIAFVVSFIPRVAVLNLGYWWLPLVIIFYPIVYLIYISSSKEVARRFPKNQRRWGLPGVVGIALYVLVISIFVTMMVNSMIVSKRGYKIPIDRIELEEDEFTDGRVIFKKCPSWSYDSTAVLNRVQDAFYFKDTLSLSRICVVGAREEYEPSRHYYIYSIFENQPLDTRYFKEEVEHFQNEDDKTLVYVDQYEYAVDSTLFYWTYASIIDKRYSKSVRFSVVDRDSLRTSIQDALQLISNSMTDLSDRLLKKDRIDKEDDYRSSNNINDPPQPVTE